MQLFLHHEDRHNPLSSGPNPNPDHNPYPNPNPHPKPGASPVSKQGINPWDFTMKIAKDCSTGVIDFFFLEEK